MHKEDWHTVAVGASWMVLGRAASEDSNSPASVARASNRVPHHALEEEHHERRAEAESSALGQLHCCHLSHTRSSRGFPEIVKSARRVEFGNWKFAGMGGVVRSVPAQITFLEREPP